ncbi:Antitoxin DinJ [compost metagenome]
MATTDAIVQASIDAKTRDAAAAVLDGLGLTIPDAIRLMLLRVADEQRLPFFPQAPSASSRTAMAEVADGKVATAASVPSLMADLNADD